MGGLQISCRGQQVVLGALRNACQPRDAQNLPWEGGIEIGDPPIMEQRWEDLAMGKRPVVGRGNARA